MKIKHWQGYGCVNAKKIFDKKMNGKRHVQIRVTGMHEWGLEPYYHNEYCVYEWLGKRYGEYNNNFNYNVSDKGCIKDEKTGYYVEFAVYNLFFEEE